MKDKITIRSAVQSALSVICIVAPTCLVLLNPAVATATTCCVNDCSSSIFVESPIGCCREFDTGYPCRWWHRKSCSGWTKANPIYLYFDQTNSGSYCEGDTCFGG